jgi:HSP20 family protein
MHTIIHSGHLNRRTRSSEAIRKAAFRSPSYDCREQSGKVEIVVYVPGVDASGVEIEARGADLMVTARKPHFVRVNWQALHLEPAQRDYQLRLRLGTGLEFRAMRAEIQDGVLTISVPRRQDSLAGHPARLRRVA